MLWAHPRAILALSLALCQSASCSLLRPAPDPPPAYPVERLAAEAAEELDLVAAELEEYGTISASAAPLIRDPQGMFAFRLPISATEMFLYNQQVEGSSVQTEVQSENVAVRFGYEQNIPLPSGRGGAGEARSGGGGGPSGGGRRGGSPGGGSGRAAGGPSASGSGRTGAGGSPRATGTGRGSGAAPSLEGEEGSPASGNVPTPETGQEAVDDVSDTDGLEVIPATVGASPEEGGGEEVGTPAVDRNQGTGASSGKVSKSAGSGRGAGAASGGSAKAAGGGRSGGRAAGASGRSGGPPSGGRSSGRSGGPSGGAGGGRDFEDGAGHPATDRRPLAGEDQPWPEPTPVTLLSPPLPRRHPASYALRLSDLINLTANDYVRKQVLEWSSDPDLASLGENKVLLAAVLTVSVRPGWRTRFGYIGEVDVRIQYASKEAEEIVPAPPSRHPLAFAIFPGMDSQVLDVQASRQRQQTLSVIAEAAAIEAGGGMKVDLLRLLGHDLGTLTAVNTVVGYNMSGRHFGWHFYPPVTAQADPASPTSGPGHVLQPQSFPALVFILMDKDDLPVALGGTYDPGLSVLEHYDAVRRGLEARLNAAPRQGPEAAACLDQLLAEIDAIFHNAGAAARDARYKPDLDRLLADLVSLRGRVSKALLAAAPAETGAEPDVKDEAGQPGSQVQGRSGVGPSGSLLQHRSDVGPTGGLLSPGREGVRGGDGATPARFPPDAALQASLPPGEGAAGFDHIIFRFSTRWIPTGERTSRPSPPLSWLGARGEAPPRMSEQRFVEWACRLAAVRQKLESAMRLCAEQDRAARADAAGPGGSGRVGQALPPRDDLPVLRTLENRLYMLEAMAIGTDVAWAIPLPAPVRPAELRPMRPAQGPRAVRVREE